MATNKVQIKEKKIKDKSFYEILEQVGFPIDLGELADTYKLNANKEDVMRFESEIKKLGINSVDNYVKVMLKNQNVFDKEKYFLRCAILLEKDYNSEMLNQSVLSAQQENTKKVLSKIVCVKEFCGDIPSHKLALIKKAKSLLEKIDIIDIKKSRSKTPKYEFISSKTFAGSKTMEKRKAEGQEKLEQIDMILGLEDVVKYLEPVDIYSICKYENVGKALEDILSYDIEQIKISQEEIGNRFSYSTEKSPEEISATKNIIQENVEYLNLEKMLLLANYRYYESVNNNFISRENFDRVSRLEKFTKQVNELIKSKRLSLKFSGTIYEVTPKSLEKDIEILKAHFINGEYYNSNQLYDLEKSLIEGRTSLEFIEDPEEFKTAIEFGLLHFEKEDFDVMISNSQIVVQYLIKCGLETNETIRKRIFEGKRKINSNLLISVMKEDIITDEEFMKLYSEGKISIEETLEAQKQLQNSKDFSKFVSSEKLITLFLSPNKKEEFDRYRQIYKALMIDGKTVEEKKEISEEILSLSTDLLVENEMFNLYNMGLIAMDTLVDYVGEEALNTLYKSGELKPADARRLFDSEIIKKENIQVILQNPEVTSGEKIALIFSTFSNPEDAELVEELLTFVLPVEKIHKNKKSKKEIGEESKSNENSIKNTSAQEQLEEDDTDRLTKARARWTHISEKDPDYKQLYLKDGHIFFYLPNKRKYLVEKLFDSRKLNDKQTGKKAKALVTAYGSASYIFEKEEFEKNAYKFFEEIDDTKIAGNEFKDLIDLIRKNKSLNRSAIVELYNQNRKCAETDAIIKVIHLAQDSWEDDIDKSLGDKPETKNKKDKKQDYASQVVMPSKDKEVRE